MNFLAKLGKAIATGLQLVTGFAPIFAQAYPSSSGTLATVTDDLTKIAGIVQSVEVFGAVLVDKGIGGADKLRAATPQIAQIILQSELLVNHKIKDEEKFRAGCSKLGDGMADVLNSIE